MYVPTFVRTYGMVWYGMVWYGMVCMYGMGVMYVMYGQVGRQVCNVM